MELEYFSEFIVFAKYLNISKASRKLLISQSTLSHHIAALEKELGVPLVNRAQPMTLTSAGRALVRQTSEWLKTYDSIVENVRNAAQQTLELCVCLDDTRTGAHHSLYAALFKFSKLHPEVYVRYVTCTDSTALAALKDTRLDCVGVIMCPIPSDLEAGVVYHRVPALYPNHLYVWLDKTHPLAKRKTLRWKDLNGVDLPVPSNFNRLWGTTMPQLLVNHGVSVNVELNALEPHSFLHLIGPDEVQIYDDGYKDFVAISVDDNRMLKRIDEPDAVSESYIAYLPDRVSPALKLFIEYIDTLQDAVPEE